MFRIGMIASAVFTVLSSAFNLYVMRRGTLLVGEEGNPFTQDLGALPRLALLFVISGAMKAWRLIVDVVGRGVGAGDVPGAALEVHVRRARRVPRVPDAP